MAKLAIFALSKPPASNTATSLIFTPAKMESITVIVLCAVCTTQNRFWLVYSATYENFNECNVYNVSITAGHIPKVVQSYSILFEFEFTRMFTAKEGYLADTPTLVLFVMHSPNILAASQG